jgi:uncharacterized protein
MIRERIKEETKQAMLTHDSEKLSTLRLISAALKDKDIAARPAGKTDGISDEEILSLLQSMIKQRNESIEMYKKGARQDLVDKEQAEINVIQSFLPQQLSDEETARIVVETIQAVGASSMKDMGKVMGSLRGKYVGTMDFAKASVLIKEKLS